MIKIKEKDLNKVFKDFKNKDIIIEFENGIFGKIKFEKADIIYDEEIGFINIINKKNKLRINTTTTYGYMMAEEGNTVKIRVDCRIQFKNQ